MRLREVFRYELSYRLRSRSTWFYAFFLFMVMMWGTLGTSDGDAVVHANAPHRVAQMTALFGGLFGLLASAALFGDAAVRDVAAGMDPLLFTTRIRKREYLVGRYLAALVVNAIVILAIPIGHAVAGITPIIEAGAFGPFRLAAYVQPLLLFLLPNLILVGAILFSIGALSRHTVSVYLGAIGIFIGYLTAANYWSHVDNPIVSALGDPLGVNALAEMTRYWSPAEQERRLVGFPLLLVLNRLLWAGAAAGVLGLLVRTFRFAHSDGGRGRARVQPVADAAAERASAVRIPIARGTFGSRTRVAQTLAVARNTYRETLAGWPFRLVLLGAAGIVLLMGWNVTETVFESSTWPVTHLVAGTVVSQRISFIPWVIIILFAGEFVWKERDVGVAEIADSVPVSNGSAMLGRFLALVALIASVLLGLMAGGILMQTLQGYRHYEPGLYARILFGVDFIEWVLLAACAMTVHVLVNHKYVGHILALSAVVLPRIAPSFGLRHHLLLYNTDPGWKYSAMNGFGPFVLPFVSFKAYWAAWALLLGVVAVLFRVRGRETAFAHRLAIARQRLTGTVARTAAAAVALIALIGGFVFYNTNILNAYESVDDAGSRQAAYEKRYSRFERIPQPTLARAVLRVELYPDESRAELSGVYGLVNQTGTPIDSIHVYLDPRVGARSFSLDRPARPVVTDDETGYHIFALDRPILPGDSARLTFEARYERRGFTNAAPQTEVVANGTYFGRPWLPFIGYQPVFELSGDAARKRLGLAPKNPLPGPDDVDARQRRDVIRNESLVDVDATIGTAADQTAITTGMLRRAWTENGRRYFRYETERPAPFSAEVMSGRYEVRRDSVDGVALELFHHPAHGANSGSMMRGMKAAVAYYTQQYGPYRYSQLRIVEVPPYSIFGRAHPGTIAFSEDAFFGRTKADEVDQMFYGAAHEVGHQWQASSAPVRGIGFLSESFANYSAMMVVENAFGLDAARKAYGFHMERYLVGRAEQSREVPPLDVDNQTYIMYRKGAIALYSLRDMIGEAAMNAALRRFLTRYRDGAPPYPTALDQFAELRAATPDSLHSMLTDLFETVTLWSVKTEAATVRPASGGTFEVTLDVVASKTRADAVGNEKEVPMNDLIDVGVFAPSADGELGVPLYVQRHRLRSGRQTIRVLVSREPARAGIDPYRKLIDRDHSDNVVRVAGPTG